MQHELTKRAKVAEIRDALLGGSSLPDEKKTEIMAEAAATIQALFEALSTPHEISFDMGMAGDERGDYLTCAPPSESVYEAMEAVRVAEML